MSTLFWYDPWLDSGFLKDRFNRLFKLSVNNMATVTEMNQLCLGEGGETWRWRRRLWALEEDSIVPC